MWFEKSAEKQFSRCRSEAQSPSLSRVSNGDKSNVANIDRAVGEHRLTDSTLHRTNAIHKDDEILFGLTWPHVRVPASHFYLSS